MMIEAKEIRAARIHLRDCIYQWEAHIFNEEVRCSVCWSAKATLTGAGYHEFYVPRTMPEVLR
jgi:hypothetical protein